MRPVLSSVGFIVVIACGGPPPCEGCDGELFVDLTGDLPVFSMRQGDAHPYSLYVGRLRGDNLCDPNDLVAWYVADLPEGSLPITYGVLPAGATDTCSGSVYASCESLLDGSSYRVSFHAPDGQQPPRWTAYFTEGDADSFVANENAGCE